MAKSTIELFPNGFVRYFENEFQRNTLKTLKAPATVVRRWNNFASDDDKEVFYSNMAQKYIDALSAYKKKFRIIPWIWFESDTQEITRELICEAVQFCMYNNDVWERVNGSTISTPSISIGVDTQGWLLTIDMFGLHAKNMIKVASYDDYELVEDGFFHTQIQGEYKILGRITQATLAALPELNI